MRKKALITGITGQDGYFLSKLLLNKGYETHGLARRNSQKSLGNLVYLPKEEREAIILHWGDITDNIFIDTLIQNNDFDEIYHLAAQSFVALSFENPRLTYDANISGTLNLLNAVKRFSQKTGFYFAATSELFGKAQSFPQNERTPFYPRSPYGISKLAGFWTVKNFRESYGLFAVNGILFNHESEFRGEEFVTRKISKAVARIKLGLQDKLTLGNLRAKRDWGYAGDYVEAMWLMLQHGEADDFSVATGQTHSVKDFVEAAFGFLGLDWKKYVEHNNSSDLRPAEVDFLIGDASKAKEKLGWKPKIDFENLVKIMVATDLKRERQALRLES